MQWARLAAPLLPTPHRRRRPAGLAKFNHPSSATDDPSAPAPPAPGSPPRGAGAGGALLGAAAAAAASGTAGPSERTGVCGTSWYISPEIANGWASYDEKVGLI